MPVTKKSTAVYRPFLREAWHRTLLERDVWLFGVFAALIGTGSAIELVLRVWGYTETPLVYRLFPALEYVSQWANQILAAPTADILIPALVIAVVVILIVALGVWSQGVILLSAMAKKGAHTSLWQTAKKARIFFWKILAIDLFFKLLLVGTIVLLFTTPIAAAPPLSSVLETLRLLFGYLAIFAIPVIFIYTLTSLISRKRTILQAIDEGFITFFRHPVVSLEIAFLLFIFSMLLGSLLILFLTLLTIPYTLAYLFGAWVGSVLVTNLATAVTFFVATAVLITSIGILCAYNYTVLALAFEKLRKQALSSKAQRVAKTLSWL